MKPSAFRILATSTLSREAGMSTRSRSAWLAFRIRVSISAIGSVIDMRDSADALRASDLSSSRHHPAPRGLPGGLDDAGDLPPQGQVAEADAAHLELPQVTSRAAADPAPVVAARGELGRPPLLQDQTRFRHGASRLLAEREAEVREQGPGDRKST